MTDQGFDVVPLDEMRPWRFVDRRRLKSVSCQPVERFSDPIHASLLVTANLGLADGVRLLGELPFFFVLGDRGLCGIVTPGDLQKPAVSMVLPSLILAGEVGLDELIWDAYGDTWLEHVSPSRRRILDDVYSVRVRNNTEISRLKCLMLTDRLSLTGKSDALVAALGFDDRRQFKAWSRELAQLRDVLAHGGSLLDKEPALQDAIRLLDRVRAFSQRVWDVVGVGEQPFGRLC